MGPWKFALLAGVCIGCAHAAVKKSSVENLPDVQDEAAAFGALESIRTAALSPEGKRLIFVGSDAPSGTVAVVVELETGVAKRVARAEGNPFNLISCEWSASDRIVCGLIGQIEVQGMPVPLFRTLAMDADGKNQLYLGQKDTMEQMGMRLSDGKVIDWLSGVDGTVMMTRSYMPEQTTGTLLARKEEGLGVDLIDTRTGKVQPLERPGRDVVEYLSDGAGNIRIMTTAHVTESLGIPEARSTAPTGMVRLDTAGVRIPVPTARTNMRYGQSYLRGVNKHLYRLPDDRFWRPLGSYTFDGSTGRGGRGMTPLAIDPLTDSAYVLETLDGRDALYRIALDGSMKRELVFANKLVDVDGVVRVGRNGRVIGASYVTDRREVEYFDPEFKKIHGMLERALPKTPLIEIMNASADE